MKLKNLYEIIVLVLRFVQSKNMIIKNLKNKIIYERYLLLVGFTSQALYG